MRLGLTVPLLLVAAALAFASGARSHVPEPPRRGDRARHDGGPTIASTLDVIVGDEVQFAFRITNGSSKRIELRFPSGQTHEVIVLDPQEREVWRWSHGRMFTQAMQNKMLGVSDTLVFRETWRPDATGTYTAVASLLSENHPTEQRVEFAVPAAQPVTR